MTPLDSALAYAGLGWSVLPLHSVRGGRCTCGNTCSNIGKHPLGRLVPNGVHDATTAANVIRDWWRQCPDANVGIATGALSRLVVLDVDPRHGGDDSLAALLREHGDFPETVENLTGGGGRHLVFVHPGVHVPNRAGLALGLDVRGDGGFIVAPPSLHLSGRRYLWAIGFRPDETPLAELPAWFLERLCHGQTDGEARPTDEWVALVRDGANAGQRNDAVARLAGYLLRRRPAPRVVLELLRAWNESRCRPRLSDDEITKTVDSIARKEAARRRGAIDADGRN